jgi:hypothetical protein
MRVRVEWSDWGCFDSCLLFCFGWGGMDGACTVYAINLAMGCRVQNVPFARSPDVFAELNGHYDSEEVISL